MSLRKSPTLTPALLAANRRNASRSTGPRTAQGKASSRLNGLRYGRRSRHYLGFINALADAPPGMVNVVVQRLLAKEYAAHPLFVDIANAAIIAEHELCAGGERRGRKAAKKAPTTSEAGMSMKPKGWEKFISLEPDESMKIKHLYE